ncbi:MAG: RIP metalloprotease, partial [Phycisphaerae bacterium]
MDPLLGHADLPLAAMDLAGWLNGLWQFTKVLIGFSLIIFVHELGHFLAAKWCGVRVHRFAVGFGPRVFGYRSGEGLTFGGKPNYTPEEIQEKGYGETDYCLNILPLGGYVKMMGESDFDIDDETGEINVSDDPRAFSNRPVSSRMTVVSAGVVFNLLFSAIAFMSVFLIGLDMPVPVVGSVLASSPADRAGLLPGDEIISINGHAVDSWRDVVMRESLANGPLSFEIVRDGAPLPGPITITPEDDPIDRMPSIGAAQKNIPYVGADYPPDAEEPIRLKQDRILRVNGE